MIRYNGEIIKTNHFPDGTLLIKQCVDKSVQQHVITWLYEKEEEVAALYFLTKHLKAQGIKEIELKMPYIPNARQDRIKCTEDVFTLKYFADLINSLNFCNVKVLDPHSYVSEALINRIEIQSPKYYVEQVIQQLREMGHEQLLLFYPDEGAMKRYSALFKQPYVFGIKKRDWYTGEIQGLSIAGPVEQIKECTVLMIDDICSRGGTFYYSAKALKDLGAKTIYLYVSHCENTILEGELLKSNLISRVYTTNSIFTRQHKDVEVMDYE